MSGTGASDDHEPTIVSATVAAGHDGVAEAAITVRYPNGAERSMSLPYEAVDRALDIAHVSSLDDLIGLPWTTLVVEAADPPRSQQSQPQPPQHQPSRQQPSQQQSSQQ